jgi:hypothetical protein
MNTILRPIELNMLSSKPGKANGRCEIEGKGPTQYVGTLYSVEEYLSTLNTWKCALRTFLTQRPHVEDPLETRNRAILEEASKNRNSFVVKTKEGTLILLKAGDEVHDPKTGQISKIYGPRVPRGDAVGYHL